MKLLRPLIASSLLHAATAQTAEAADAEPQRYAPYNNATVLMARSRRGKYIALV